MKHFERRAKFTTQPDRGPRRTKPKGVTGARLALNAQPKPPLPTGASLAQVQERECGDKVPYGSQTVAQNAATLMHWRDLQDGVDMVLDAYVCRWCAAWHIGHRREF